MQIVAKTPEEYINELPEDRKTSISLLRKSILDHLPIGFEEGMEYGMLSYHVPFSLYPKGYHANPKQPLPFMAIASQKNYISVYHMGIYANEALLHWFTGEYAKRYNTKLNMGKGCIRFSKPNQIPYDLIGELVSKISVDQWIAFYDKQRSNNVKGI